MYELWRCNKGVWVLIHKELKDPGEGVTFAQGNRIRGHFEIRRHGKVESRFRVGSYELFKLSEVETKMTKTERKKKKYSSPSLLKDVQLGQAFLQPSQAKDWARHQGYSGRFQVRNPNGEVEREFDL